MKISESYGEKAVIAIQAVIVAVFVWFTLRQEIKRTRKSTRKLQAVREKEAIRYTKDKYQRKRRQLKKQPQFLKNLYKK